MEKNADIGGDAALALAILLRQPFHLLTGVASAKTVPTFDISTPA